MIFHQKQNTYSLSNYSFFRYDDVTWESHFHKDFEIVYVLSGSLKCSIGLKCGVLNEGEYGMCLPYETHAYLPSEGTSYFVWGFSENYVRAFSSAVKGKAAGTFIFHCPRAVTSYVLDISCSECYSDIYSIKSCLYALCSRYLSQTVLSERDKKEAKVFDIIHYIEDNFSKDITLSDAAQHLGYDYHYISRYFKKHFNMNFGDFLGTFRLQKALELLEETDKSITSIAFESGFQSIRAFNQSFKKRTGTSPSQYRKSIFQQCLRKRQIL